jgi:hypothetical protein
LQTVNALLYALGIYLLTFVIALFVGVLIVFIRHASTDRSKRAAKQ